MPKAKVIEEDEVVEKKAPQAEPEPEEVNEVAEEEEAEEEESFAEEAEWDSYSMPPDQEVWPGGANFAQINAWKDEFGDIYVTAVTHDKNVVWRTLNRFEYRRTVKQLEQAVSSGQMTQAEANMNNEEMIAEMCILYPKYQRANPVAEMAGLASTITQQVMEASAFSAVEVRQL